jgi:alpha-tubulin suppressor-like RCC1 family protein
VLCWGDNSFGELGDGSTTDSVIPVGVIGLESQVTAIAGGSAHTCARTAGGAMLCWGHNGSGQLGDNTYTHRSTPVLVSGLAGGITAIDAGSSNGCAVTVGGGALCWGYNAWGQVGDGTTVNRLVPAAVSGLSAGVVDIALGAGHTCALTVAGGVSCWGDNVAGQLGNGTTDGSEIPIPVSGLASGVMAIASGQDHSCALTTVGGVVCWGRGSYGQLGTGFGTNSSVPVAVSGLGNGVSAIAAGYNHTCALTDGGGVLCWGFNSVGQLGDGTSQNTGSLPVHVSGLTSGIAAIAAGSRHTCALTLDGELKCWGDDSEGQLGDGGAAAFSVPVAVVGFAGGSSGVPQVPVLGSIGRALLATLLGITAIALRRRLGLGV